MTDEDFFVEFGFTFEEAEENLKTLKNKNKEEWAQLINKIETEASKMSVSEIIKSNRNLVRKKSIVAKVIEKK